MAEYWENVEGLQVLPMREFQSRFDEFSFLRFLYVRPGRLFRWAFEAVYTSREAVDEENAHLTEEEVEDGTEFEFRCSPVPGGRDEVRAVNAYLVNSGSTVYTFTAAVLSGKAGTGVVLGPDWTPSLAGHRWFNAARLREQHDRALRAGLPFPESPFETWVQQPRLCAWRLKRLFLSPAEAFQAVFDWTQGYSPYRNPQDIDCASLDALGALVTDLLRRSPGRAFALRYSFPQVSLTPKESAVLEESAYWASVYRVWKVRGIWVEPELPLGRDHPAVDPRAETQFRALCAQLKPFMPPVLGAIVAGFLVDPCIPADVRCWIFSSHGRRCPGRAELDSLFCTNCSEEEELAEYGMADWSDRESRWYQS